MSSSHKIQISVEPEAKVVGRALVSEVIDPEIHLFEKWFAGVDAAGSRLTRMEKEVLRSYLYQKLVGTI